ncbi:hypothetical protein O181_010261 [Austropuccinia psidii MF-1]|uniref:Reverse transcriptase Ty1/copia-type domain-containing protein n=1 Tax=Austropuccinia psidii MF-1 TaxID=1389203 RepID=A0A9Q3GK86_9BASI|nr:hypothetical protein [Austropuccinia psidii MF-1]
MKEQEIKLADGFVIKTLGCGTIQLEFQNIILTFSNTLYIPSLATNLISMTTFLRTHHIIKLLNKDEFEVINKDMRQFVTGSLASGNLTLYYSPKVLSASTIPGTGNVKITHHIKFIPTEFPFLKFKSTPTDYESFILVPNPTDTIPIEMPPIVQNKSNYNFTSIRVNPTMEQNSSSKKLNPQVNPSIDQNPSSEESIPVHNDYSWVPEQELIPQNEIFDHLSLDPKAYHEAINGLYSQDWKEAIKSEINNMANHNVWIPTTPNHDVKPLSTTWVFKRKTDENGNLSKFKARLCVRGFNQKEGIDYTEVFSPTGRLSSLQLLLTLCHINQYPIEQMDICCAFLNGNPKEIPHIH